MPARLSSLDHPLADRLGPVLDLLGLGGPVAAILGAMSIVALGLVLAKLWQLARLGRAARGADHALALWRSGERDAARLAVARASHPALLALALAFEGLARGLPELGVRAEAARLAERALDDLRGWLRPLEVIAALAPLLGLFGTVLGMIDAFAALEAAGSQVDPAALSGGIWVALLTTALGLGVAMPVVAMLALLERRIERAERATDDALAAAFAPGLAPVTDDEWEPRHASVRLAQI